MTIARARDVARDDRARRDERLLADLDAGREQDPAADAACAPQHGTAQRARPAEARHRVVVHRHDAGADEDVVLDDDPAREPGVRLDAHPRADAPRPARSRCHARRRSARRSLAPSRTCA